MLQSKEQLIENLTEVIQASKIKNKKKIVNDIKKYLAAKYQIVDVQGWVNDPEKLKEVDLRELFLFSEQIYLKTKDMDLDVNPGIINPTEFFTNSEMKESRQFSGVTEIKQNEMEFPITFANATIVGNNAYMVTMSIQTINKLMDNNLIYYNYETQREATYVKRKDQIVIAPTLNKNSVKEITDHLLQGTLVPTVLVFNAETRSTTDESGEELIYDSKKMELTVTRNTRISITDGFHRITGARNALQINSELDFNFAVLITNFNTRKAQQYMAQISKSNPVSKTRIQELEATRFSDNVVQQLKEESELKGRISQTNRIHSLNRELCSYNVLADSIDEEFTMETKLDSLDVSDYLVSYFDYLIGSFPEQFIHNVAETRKVSLMVENSMFVGYIVLARRLYESKIKANKVVNIIKEINFNRDNYTWQQIGVVDEKGNLTETNKSRKAIKQYFEEIEL
jgi:hypothetical protein